MLRRDVDESVVAAAAHTPFEAQHRIFVLERADTMNDEAANALLKTLEEPPAYVVLILITDKLTQVLPTIASRCQAVRFDPPAPASSRNDSSPRASRPRPPKPPRGSRSATRTRRSRSRSATAPRSERPPSTWRERRCTARPAPRAPGSAVLDRAKQRGQSAKQEVEQR